MPHRKRAARRCSTRALPTRSGARSAARSRISRRTIRCGRTPPGVPTGACASDIAARPLATERPRTALLRPGQAAEPIDHRTAEVAELLAERRVEARGELLIDQLQE